MRKMVVILFAAVLLFAISGGVWAKGKQEESQDKRWDARCVEFTTDQDRTAVPPGDIDGLVPGTVIYTKVPDASGPPNPRNSTVLLGTGDEIDALANICDLYFPELIQNTAHLLISVDGDPGRNAIWIESRGGARSAFLWYTHQNLCNDNGQPCGNLNDVDAFEIYQTCPSTGAPPSEWDDDADCYSKVGDPPGGYSVWTQHGPYVPKEDIVAAITSLGWVGSSGEVDVDALMVFDRGIEYVWDTLDKIIFSISATGTWASGNPVHGGELVVLPHPTGGSALFLEHGNHLWDSAWHPSQHGLPTDEVDAIEALGFTGGGGPGGQTGVPSLTNWGLLVLLVLLILSGVYVIYHRRRAAVR